jgi:hypothetical protein
MKERVAVGLLLWGLMAIACSRFAQTNPTAITTFSLTPVPIVMATVAPTNTALPLTETPETISEWEGIPIIPGAMTGEGDEEGYVFTIRTTPQRVQEYYQLELEKLGWQAFVTDDSDSALTLIFTNDTSATLTITVIAKGEEALVLLAK